MAENSEIAWTDHTVNPWWGCSKVSPACANCYAEGVAHRFGGALWGPDAPRMIRVDAATREALRYERRAAKLGVRYRVFCASMADFFEDRPDLDEPRLRFLDVMRRTPHLDWLILTKRPEAIRPLLKRAYNAAEVIHCGSALAVWLWNWLDGMFVPANVWLGTTAEDQAWANKRIPDLLATPAARHFVSIEPILERVDLTQIPFHGGRINALTGLWDVGKFETMAPRLDWVIVGGESGPGAREMSLLWAISLRTQCATAGVSFFMKQLSKKGWPKTFRDFDSFPYQIQAREFPASVLS
jgi:protein gp37